jgi:ammonium transporter, Amt family
MEQRFIRRLAVPLLLFTCSSPTLLARAASGSDPVVPAAMVAPDIRTNRLACVEQAVSEAKSSGDNAWMLTSSALVLLMTGPGLALFYGGLVRRKNVLSTMMQTFSMMAVVTVIWAIVGCSLAFGSGGGFIGGLHNVFLRGVGLQPDADYAATVPAQTYMVFQLMFAIITSALIAELSQSG